MPRLIDMSKSTRRDTVTSIISFIYNGHRFDQIKCELSHCNFFKSKGAKIFRMKMSFNAKVKGLLTAHAYEICIRTSYFSLES